MTELVSVPRSELLSIVNQMRSRIVAPEVLAEGLDRLAKSAPAATTALLKAIETQEQRIAELERVLAIHGRHNHGLHKPYDCVLCRTLGDKK